MSKVFDKVEGSRLYYQAGIVMGVAEELSYAIQSQGTDMAEAADLFGISMIKLVNLLEGCGPVCKQLEVLAGYFYDLGYRLEVKAVKIDKEKK